MATHKMYADEMREAMIEITLEKPTSKLKEKFPDQYAELEKEIAQIKRSGKEVEIPPEYF